MSLDIEISTSVLPSLNPAIMNRYITAKIAASQPSKPIITITPPDVKTSWITGKGYGLIVTKEFKSGELILVERPLIMANHVCDQSLKDSIANAINTAPSEALVKFYRLQNPLALWSFWDDAHSGNLLTIEENIWNSNCLAFPQDPLDLENQWKWNKEERYLELYAWSDLKVGDEVTIDYIGLPAWEMTAKQRRSELARDYNFLCRCKACDNELEYWDILEEKERKIFPRRFSHQEGNCSCDLCDHRGPEDYHCSEPECSLAKDSNLSLAGYGMSDCEFEYYWGYSSDSDTSEEDS